MKSKWNLNKWQFMGLALYSCAFPLGVYLQNERILSNGLLLSLINLPFLVILGPLLMLAEPFHLSRVFGHLLAWTIIFAQSYFTFVHLRSGAEKNGASTRKVLMSSLGRLVAIALLTLVIGGFVLALIFRFF